MYSNMYTTKDYYNDESRPIKCYICEGIEFTQKITDRIGYITMEYELRCSNCDELVGYWATGYFDPYFVRGLPQFLNKFNALLIK